MLSDQVERHIVWVCCGCDACQPLDGSDRQSYPCTDTSPSMDGAEVVRAEDYDRLRAEIDEYRSALNHARQIAANTHIGAVGACHMIVDIVDEALASGKERE